jgi:hypothetical protein
MIAVEGESLFHGFVDDAFQTGFIGVAELLIERAQDSFRALDQVIVVED